MENWKSVLGFEGLYEISNRGRVKSVKRSGARGGLMKIGMTGGYPSIMFMKENRRYWRKIHRLVAQAFISNPKNLAQVNHKNGDKTDNHVQNLEWCSSRHNHEHSIKVLGNHQKGERNGNAKFTEREVSFLRWLKKRFPEVSGGEIARFYKMADVTILDIWNGKKWKNVL